MLFYQKEWETTSVKGAIEGPGLKTKLGSQIDLTIKEYGAKSSTNCAKTGDVWLPDQGKLDSLYVTDNSYGAFTWNQPVLEQNLGGGHEKLFARTVMFTTPNYYG